MAQYEGIVASVREDGTAEVIIQPERDGIPGAAPAVNRRVCHRATESSTISIVAHNNAGAEVGDRVSVNRSTAALARNALALVGIPLAGLCMGIASAALLTKGFTNGTPTAALTVLAGVSVGIVIGVIVFRRGSAGTAPVIDRIIQTRREMASQPVQDQCTFRNETPSCNACSGSA